MLCGVPHWKYAHAALFAILSASAINGQNPQRPRFEVASIRPGGDIFSTNPQRSPGRFTWTTQLNYLIGYACGLDFARVSGQGIGTVYTINAVLEPQATEGALRLMLQSLLAERFKMRFHRVVETVDGYAIFIGRGGIKMKESAALDEPAPGDPGRDTPSIPINEGHVYATMPSSGVTSITGRRATLSQLTETLARSLGIPLSDRTGLQGKYDFAFRFSRDLMWILKRTPRRSPLRFESTLALASGNSEARLKHWLSIISTSRPGIDVARHKPEGFTTDSQTGDRAALPHPSAT